MILERYLSDRLFMIFPSEWTAGLTGNNLAPTPSPLPSSPWHGEQFILYIFFLAAAFPSAENISTGNKTMEIANTINWYLIPPAFPFVFPQIS